MPINMSNPDDYDTENIEDLELLIHNLDSDHISLEEDISESLMQQDEVEKMRRHYSLKLTRLKGGKW